MKNDKTKLIIWATVALVIGVVIGTFLVAPATTGEAKKSLTGSVDVDVYETYAYGAIGRYVASNGGAKPQTFYFRPSTDGKIKSVPIQAISISKEVESQFVSAINSKDNKLIVAAFNAIYEEAEIRASVCDTGAVVSPDATTGGHTGYGHVTGVDKEGRITGVHVDYWK